ncbi:MAG: transcriptional regulator [Bacteroidaceae bacterium]|nr:transcriptional regulator [Bacteroidaceae bacterium]
MFVSAFADAIPPMPECRYKDTTFSIYNGKSDLKMLKLSAAGYIEVEKTFKGKRPCTLCRDSYLYLFS